MRHDIYHYFQQACRRPIGAICPPRWVVEGDATAGFVLEIGAHGQISSIEYRCTTCMTLVAFCEHLAEQLRGATVDHATALSAGDLLGRHPEVPQVRQSRAHLAVAAVHAALEAIRR